MKGSIYKITNLLNGKTYIGQTTQPIEKRFKSHCYKDGCTKLYNAMKKYGKKNFSIDLVESIETDSEKDLHKQLDKRESFYIRDYDSINNGYNIRDGGQGNYIMTDEHKRKISEAQKGEKGNM